MATKQPLKKKEVKKPTLSSFKEKMGLTTTKASNADKPMEWLIMPITGFSLKKRTAVATSLEMSSRASSLGFSFTIVSAM